MKKLLTILMAMVLAGSMLAGCGGKGTEQPATSEDTGSKPAVSEPVKEEKPAVTGEIYDTGDFSALVPTGWLAIPSTDVFAEEEGALDATAISICKDGESDLDLFYKPYVRFDYYDPYTEMMKPSSEWYENVEDIEPFTTGTHTWSGFKAEDDYGKMAVLWAEEGDYQYQATVWLEVSGNTITLEDADVLAILESVKPTGTGTVSGGTDAPAEDPADEPIEEPVVEADAYSWWDGDWYGWWCIEYGGGTYEPINNICWEAFADIEYYGDGSGYLTIWDSETSKDAPLIRSYINIESGTDERGTMVTDYGTFFDAGQWLDAFPCIPMDLGYYDLHADPAASTVSHFDNMIELYGTYYDPNDNSNYFVYDIFLRPWGTDWSDVAYGDTEGCLFSDMMPMYYNDWYVPLLNLGVTELPASFEEGFAIIQNGAAGSSAGSSDLGDKEGADGYVELSVLQEQLEWCKRETDYDMPYEEIAAQLGAHGKQIDSLFEGISIYRWWATEEDYIQISFNINDDGTETWNVTQWSGID